MSGNGTDRIRLIKVTEGNLRNSHLYVKDHLDFFPSDAVGGPRRRPNGSDIGRSNGDGLGGISVLFDGLDKTVRTDIGSDKATGKPRSFLRCRSEVRRFYRLHEVKAGTYVALERRSDRSYRA